MYVDDLIQQFIGRLSYWNTWHIWAKNWLRALAALFVFVSTNNNLSLGKQRQVTEGNILNEYIVHMLNISFNDYIFLSLHLVMLCF